MGSTPGQTARNNISPPVLVNLCICALGRLAKWQKKKKMQI